MVEKFDRNAYHKLDSVIRCVQLLNENVGLIYHSKYMSRDFEELLVTYKKCVPDMHFVLRVARFKP